MYRIVCLLFILSLALLGQTTSNPDFSIIGQLNVNVSEDEIRTTGSDLELAFQGYVNPYARADVYLHKHDALAAFEVEEAVLTVERGLPLGLMARFGRMRPDLGRMNREHAHVWPFISAPAAIADFTGEEMWSSTGAELGWLLPLPWYANLSTGAFRSGFSPHHHEEDAHDHEGEDDGQPTFSVRLGQFFELAANTHLEAGLSYYNQPEHEIGVGVFDLKYKWRPDTYRGLVIQGEVYTNLVKEEHEHEEEDHGDEPEAELPELGSYFFLNYQFNRVWNLGFILDAIQHHEEDLEFLPGVFCGFSPVEESSVLRLAVKQRLHHEEVEPVFTLQLIWSLGPHKPHQF